LGYVSDLRKLVGTRPIILVGAEVLVFDSQAQLLLQQRSDTGDWTIPGGMMEPGETFEETAIREVQEETGLQIRDLELVRVYSGPQFYYQYPHGDEVFNVSALFITHSYTGKLAVDSESLSIGFYSLAAIPGPLNPLSRIVLDDYLKPRR
jgi:8-oxo-dGTP pyrophosphatase MutT (NUDIX family)